MKMKRFAALAVVGLLAFAGQAGQRYSDKTIYNRAEIVTPYVGTPPTQTGIYDDSTGLALSTNYSPADSSNGPIRGLLCTGGSGFIKVIFVNGDSCVVPVTVTAGDHEIILRACLISTIRATGTTFTGTIHPLF